MAHKNAFWEFYLDDFPFGAGRDCPNCSKTLRFVQKLVRGRFQSSSQVKRLVDSLINHDKFNIFLFGNKI